MREGGVAKEEERRQREAVKASRGLVRGRERGRGASGGMGRRGGAVIGSRGLVSSYETVVRNTTRLF